MSGALAMADTRWQAIATAPKDGANLLLATPIGDDEWDITIGAWAYGEFHCAISDFSIDGATHWQPLPEPPSREK